MGGRTSDHWGQRLVCCRPVVERWSTTRCRSTAPIRLHAIWNAVGRMSVRHLGHLQHPQSEYGMTVHSHGFCRQATTAMTQPSWALVSLAAVSWNPSLLASISIRESRRVLSCQPFAAHLHSGTAAAPPGSADALDSAGPLTIVHHSQRAGSACRGSGRRIEILHQPHYRRLFVMCADGQQR